MTRLISYIFVLLIVLAGTTWGRQPDEQNPSGNLSFWKKMNFTVAPTIWRTSGTTDWTIRFRVRNDSLPDRPIGIDSSKLTYPLNATMGGVSFNIGSDEEADRFWSVRVGLYENTTDPGSTMTDEDWEHLDGYYDLKFSYSESHVRMKTYLLTVEGTRQVYDFGKLDIAALAGLRYQWINQVMIGAIGWQHPRDPSTLLLADEASPITIAGKVLDYKITYKSPYLGMLLRLKQAEKFEGKLKTAFALVWVNDFDDHLLRGFNVTSNGTGLGVIAGVEGRKYFDKKPGGQRPYLELFANFLYYSVNATQVRYQYADAGPNESPVGSSFSMPHDIRSTQYDLGARFGLTF